MYCEGGSGSSKEDVRWRTDARPWSSTDSAATPPTAPRDSESLSPRRAVSTAPLC